MHSLLSSAQASQISQPHNKQKKQKTCGLQQGGLLKPVAHHLLLLICRVMKEVVTCQIRQTQAWPAVLFFQICFWSFFGSVSLRVRFQTYNVNVARIMILGIVQAKRSFETKIFAVRLERALYGLCVCDICELFYFFGPFRFCLKTKKNTCRVTKTVF